MYGWDWSCVTGVGLFYVLFLGFIFRIMCSIDIAHWLMDTLMLHGQTMVVTVQAVHI